VAGGGAAGRGAGAGHAEVAPQGPVFSWAQVVPRITRAPSGKVSRRALGRTVIRCDYFVTSMRRTMLLASMRNS
jgi:hypothetical protein